MKCQLVCKVSGLFEGNVVVEVTVGHDLSFHWSLSEPDSTEFSIDSIGHGDDIASRAISLSQGSHSQSVEAMRRLLDSDGDDDRFLDPG